MLIVPKLIMIVALYLHIGSERRRESMWGIENIMQTTSEECFDLRTADYGHCPPEFCDGVADKLFPSFNTAQTTSAPTSPSTPLRQKLLFSLPQSHTLQGNVAGGMSILLVVITPLSYMQKTSQHNC